MGLINNEDQDILYLFNRIEKLEKRKKIEGVVVIVGLVSTVLTILLNIPNVISQYDKYFIFPNEKTLKVFMTDYSRAYSNVVNNYVQGNEDSSELDDYIAHNDSGKKFKEEIISNIKKNIDKGNFTKDKVYEYTFNYRSYKSFEETGDSDFILVSGVSSIVKNKSAGNIISRNSNDGNSRSYEVIIDKDKKDIKIEDRKYK